jgi:alkylation response protein AidB-like acyl-CoA dehydrogenase
MMICTGSLQRAADADRPLMEGRMAFTQDPPRLDHLYRSDRALQALLRQVLPSDLVAACEPDLDRLGELGAGALYRMQLEERLDEPRLVQWDAWGKRIDRITITPLWREAERLAAEYGLVADAYEPGFGLHARIVQFAKVYLFAASTDVYSCPLAMTDGAARALLDSGNEQLIARAVPRLTSRDPARAWTSGQWMTEATGGSDVGTTQTVARREHETWKLYGRKWFTSAIGSQMALTLARPQGNPPGGRGLALFYVETRAADGSLNGIKVNRLKDKLGTRKVPTAELELDGAVAEPVCGLGDGVRHIAPMLNVTRMWNSLVAVALMRRGIDLAKDYSKRRSAFGARLVDKPLHRDTLAGMEAECQAALQLTFFVAALLGRSERASASEQQRKVLRLLTPITKALTGRQATSVLAETAECFGGAGYVEDTGIALLLRDAHVLPIWEGTTNVLALDAMRTIADGGLGALRRELGFLLHEMREPQLIRIGARIDAVMDAVEARLADGARVEADARRIALTVGRCTAAAVLARHAQWALDGGWGEAALAASRRFVGNGLDLLTQTLPADTAALVGMADAEAANCADFGP